MIGGLGDRLRSWLEARLEALRTHPVLGEVYEILDGSIGDYARDHGLMYAAAIAFYAILSLIPLIVLIASIAGFALHTFGGDTPADSLVGEVVRQLEKAIPYLGEGFEKDIRRTIRDRSELGAVSLVATLLTASQVFRALEYAFARIFSRSMPDGDERPVAKPRSFVLSKLLFGGFVTALVGGFVVLRFLLSLLRAWAERLPDGLRDLVTAPLSGESFAGHLLEGALTVVGFAVVLKVFTHQRVRTRFALVGGTLFWGFLLLGRAAYELYLGQVTDLGTVYGSFAAIMTVVLWIFYLSTMLVVCGYFSRTIQRRALFGPRTPKRGRGITPRTPMRGLPAVKLPKEDA